MLSLAAVIKARMKHLEKPEDELPETEDDNQPTAARMSNQMASVDSMEAGSSDPMAATPNPKDKGSMCNRFMVENESSSLSNEAGTGK